MTKKCHPDTGCDYCYPSWEWERGEEVGEGKGHKRGYAEGCKTGVILTTLVIGVLLWLGWAMYGG